MSDYVTITDKGHKLLRSKFGIPYGLIFAIINHAWCKLLGKEAWL